MGDNIFTHPGETIEFHSRYAIKFFDALEECMETGTVSDQSIYWIIGPPPIVLISENPNSIDNAFYKRLRYYLKFNEVKKRILNMAHVKGAL